MELTEKEKKIIQWAYENQGSPIKAYYKRELPTSQVVIAFIAIAIFLLCISLLVFSPQFRDFFDKYKIIIFIIFILLAPLANRLSSSEHPAFIVKLYNRIQELEGSALNSVEGKK
jgi:hypothetical protein